MHVVEDYLIWQSSPSLSLSVISNNGELLRQSNWNGTEYLCGPFVWLADEGIQLNLIRLVVLLLNKGVGIYIFNNKNVITTFVAHKATQKLLTLTPKELTNTYKSPYRRSGAAPSTCTANTNNATTKKYSVRFSQKFENHRFCGGL